MDDPPIRIVHVDDEARRESYATFRELLADAGIIVVPVISADEAIDTIGAELTASGLDGVLIDIMMPPGHYGSATTKGGMQTGWQLVEDIRRVYPTLPILVLSARDRSALQDHGIPFLVKPQDSATVREFIMSHVRQDESR